MNIIISVALFFLMVFLVYRAYRSIIGQIFAFLRRPRRQQASAHTINRIPKTNSQQQPQSTKLVEPPLWSSSRGEPYQPILLQFPDVNSLKSQLRELAKIAWTTEKSFRHPQFLLNPNDFAHTTAPDKVVEILLSHARQIAPGFEVSYMIPRVLVEPIPFAGGLFQVNSEG